LTYRAFRQIEKECEKAYMKHVDAGIGHDLRDDLSGGGWIRRWGGRVSAWRVK